MTRKDYQLLAKWAGRQRLPIALFQSLCNELQGQNAAFDRERFRKDWIAEICAPRPKAGPKSKTGQLGTIFEILDSNGKVIGSYSCAESVTAEFATADFRANCSSVEAQWASSATRVG